MNSTDLVNSNCTLKNTIYLWLLSSSDGSWSKTWIERQHDFTFHHLRETWNLWMTIFPSFRDIEWNFSMSLRVIAVFTYVNQAWMGFHNLEQKWKVISWNAKNCFQVWIFRQNEFTGSSLQYQAFVMGCIFHCTITTF